MSAGVWPAWSKANRDWDRLVSDDPLDPDDYLPDADLDELADRREDAENRYFRGWEGMDPSEAIA